MSRYELTLPRIGTTLEQNEEWLWVSDNGVKKRRLRLHDYATIYDMPGLYERLFCDMLKSRSWEVIPSMAKRGTASGCWTSAPAMEWWEKPY